MIQQEKLRFIQEKKFGFLSRIGLKLSKILSKDQIETIKKDESGWWFIQKDENDEEGWVPASHVSGF